MGLQNKTKNLGQIAAIWISSNAPDNKKMVWYDTISQKHKVYDVAKGDWIALNPQVVTNTDIATLKGHITGDEHGYLTVGDFYYLTDVGTLAIAITITKIWYVDALNNYVVNDLAATITAYINSDNLLIDGSTGVWNNVTGRLEFRFDENETGENLQQENDYIVIRRKSGTVWNWVKAKLSGFISAVSGNSISWNKGFYFNFRTAVDNILNKTDGIVGYKKYADDLTQMNEDIKNVSFNKQEAIDEAKRYVDQEVDADKIYQKQHSEDWSVLDNPPDVPNTNASLEDILQILVSWTQRLQKSDKIQIGSGFSPNGRSGNVNYSDTVRSAIEKLVYQCLEFNQTLNREIPMAFVETGELGDEIIEDSRDFASVTYKNTTAWKYGYKSGNLILECTIDNFYRIQPDLIFGSISAATVAIEDYSKSPGVAIGIIRNSFIVDLLDKAFRNNENPISVSAPAYLNYQADEGVYETWCTARIMLSRFDTTGNATVNGNPVKGGYVISLESNNYGMEYRPEDLVPDPDNPDEFIKKFDIWTFSADTGSSNDGSMLRCYCKKCRLSIPINAFAFAGS